MPPTVVQVSSSSAGTAELTWTPIAYQADGGHYEVLSSTTPGGPYISRGTTAATGAKTATGLNLTGLPGGTNHFVVRTFTPKHQQNPNDLTSVVSEEVSANLGPLNVSISSPDAVASEGVIDTGTFRISRDNPTGPLIVNLRRNASSTAVDSEFELAVGGNPPISLNGGDFSVTLPAGSDTLDITLTALSDSGAEAAEAVTIDLLPGAYVVDNSANSDTVTITQNGFLVTTDADGGTGSLRQAVLNANAIAGANVITFDGDLATQTITISGGQLELTETGAANRTTILGPAGGINVSGNNAARLFQINVSVTATINGLTLIDGFADQGGAIVNFGDLTVLNSVFRNNVADATAGVSGGVGGAIASYGPLNVANTVFHLNMGELGGAINSSDGLIVTDSVFSGNQAGFNGGALRLFGTTAITGSTFSNNQAVNGGGGLINHGDLTLTNSTFAFNVALDGGGLQAFEGTVDLRHVTITSNTATGAGGGFAVNSAAVTATNTIIAGNSGANQNDLFGTLELASSFNLLNQSAAAAGLGTFAGHGGPTFTVALLPGSPAINGGDPNFAGPPDFDQRGFAFDRVSGGRVDIGAYELNQVAPQVVDVIVGGSGWMAPFVDAVDGGGTGAGNGLDFSLVGTHQLTSIPWNGVDQVFLVFGEDVSASLADGDILLNGTNGGTYALGPLTYGAAGPNIATISITVGIAIDSLVLTIFDGAVTDATGNALDGEWTSGQAAPSGNSTAGGQFDFFFNVLPGDENASGQVNSTDALNVFASNTSATIEALARRDINGSGQITTTDALIAFDNNTFGLPTVPTPPMPPLPVTAAVVSASVDSLAVIDALFSTMPAASPLGSVEIPGDRLPNEPRLQPVSVASQDVDLLHARNKTATDYAAQVDEAMSQFSEEIDEEEFRTSFARRSPFAPQIRSRFSHEGRI